MDRTHTLLEGWDFWGGISRMPNGQEMATLNISKWSQMIKEILT